MFYATGSSRSSCLHRTTLLVYNVQSQLGYGKLCSCSWTWIRYFGIVLCVHVDVLIPIHAAHCVCLRGRFEGFNIKSNDKCSKATSRKQSNKWHHLSSITLNLVLVVWELSKWCLLQLAYIASMHHRFLVCPLLHSAGMEALLSEGGSETH